LFERKFANKTQLPVTTIHPPKVLETGNETGKALSKEGFATFYDDFFPRLFRYVSYRVATREEAEDLVALIFEKILEKYQSYDPLLGTLDGWVFAIARNMVSNRHRARYRHPETTLDALTVLEADFNVIELVLEKEDITRLRQYLDRLTERERELLALRYGANLPHRRIGEIMRMREDHVTVSLGRTIRKLRRFFEADEYEKQ
jgi:RNA polymerase sigma-70 factor (ECF subfamily)